jgi:Spy/CpxP family protein refolding chaperone
MSWNHVRRGAAVLGVALALAAAPLAALAESPEGPDDLVARHARRLGLDAATQAAIAHVVDEWGVRDEALREEIRLARERLHELLTRSQPDEEAVLAQQDAMAALYAETHRNRLIATLRIHERLTPEQREELVRIRTEEGPPRRFHSRGVCRADLHERCPDAAEPGSAALRCLAEHWDALAEDCQRALARVGEEPSSRGR